MPVTVRLARGGRPRSLITKERLREVLGYDSSTGVFTWKIDSSRRVKAGMVAGYVTVRGYISICVDQVKYQAHQLAWLYVHGYWPKGLLDHRNCNRIDNWIENLRDVTTGVNSQNMRKASHRSRTGLLGCWPYRDKFQAQIRLNGKIIQLGVFKTAEEGHAAYLVAKRRLHEGCTI